MGGVKDRSNKRSTKKSLSRLRPASAVFPSIYQLPAYNLPFKQWSTGNLSCVTTIVKMASSSTSILSRLPIEVVSIVYSFLPVHDIAQVRLTCKDCAKIGERHLVRDLHLMFHAKSFQNILNISLHPVLSKYVTSILLRVPRSWGRRPATIRIEYTPRCERGSGTEGLYSWRWIKVQTVEGLGGL
jgi:hypothetical protein